MQKCKSITRGATHLLFAVSLFATVMVGCSQQSDSVVRSTVSIDGEAGLQSVAVQLNWYPEAEHGGVYQANSDGTYTDAGLNVDIRPGGRATPGAPELELGRVAFAMANADDVVLFRQQGMDIVAVLAVMQNSPRCILVRQDSGVESLDQLSGMTLQRQAGRSFLEFMRSKGILDAVQEVPYHGSVSSLIADPKIAIQAYSYVEPLSAIEQGVQVRPLMVSDLGWNPYSSVLITTGKMIEEQPALVQKFVDATRKGWRNYLNDPALGNAAILAANEHGMTEKTLEFGVKELTPLALADQMTDSQIGIMNDDRWQQLVDQMDKLDPDQSLNVKAADCYTLQFLN